MLLIVDGANVVGSRPDGWWKDRARAASRLAARLAEAQGDGALAPLCTESTGALRVLLVLEGAARAASVPDDLEVLRAPRDGDSAIVELVHAAPGEVGVVTADRELTRLVRALGAHTIRPGALLAVLPTP